LPAHGGNADDLQPRGSQDRTHTVSKQHYRRYPHFTY